jgi:hypothetical protein
VEVVSDSDYAISSITKWVDKWIKDKVARPNMTLICQIKLKLIELGTVVLIHVNSHRQEMNVYTLGNHAADFLANYRLTGMTNAPRVDVGIPTAKKLETDLLCEQCCGKWKDLKDNRARECVRKTMITNAEMYRT